MTKSLRLATSTLTLFTMLSLVACERSNDRGTRSTPGPPASGANNNTKNTPGATGNGTTNQPATGPRSTTPP